MQVLIISFIGGCIVNKAKARFVSLTGSKLPNG